MTAEHRQLISYLAPAAPARRRPATGDEPFLRPEVGFTPRWFQEGLAMHLAGEGSHLWARIYVSISGRPHLVELSRTFPGDEETARKAYAKSFLAVSFMMKKLKMEGILRLLDEVRDGVAFDRALVGLMGMNVPGLEAAMGRSIRWSYVYLPLITSSSFLWLLLTLFFILVYIRKRQHDEEILARWEEEEVDDPDVPCN